ncbi:MAG TPA: methionyl-tRNA formyltransferase [Propionibacteriaceae bacterium]|nr:methionyl-tRNA formyltransferase [Propionibacteriaceae bacterium]
MRVVFAGTPEVAVPSLEAVAAAGHHIVAVLTRPPAAQGRSSRLVPSPVHQWAEGHGVPVLAPDRARSPESVAALRNLAPDCCPVVAYGQLLTERLLAIPKHGWVNLHFSLLPAYRGAAPVQRAIMAGETETGASTFRIVKELDAGPVYGEVTTEIHPSDTAGTLLDRLAVLGAPLLVETLRRIEAGAEPVPQQDQETLSYAHKIEPDEVRLDWSRSAIELDRLVRGASPEPGAWTTLGGDRFKVLLTAPVTGEGAAPGTIIPSRKTVHVATGSGLLQLVTVQPVGKRPMTACDWARGAHLGDQARFQ